MNTDVAIITVRALIDALILLLDPRSPTYDQQRSLLETARHLLDLAEHPHASPS
jgi:hypothetical protein